MPRLVLAASLLALFMIGCTAQPTATPTIPPPTVAVAVPSDTPTLTPLPPTETATAALLPPTATPTPEPITGTVLSTLNVRSAPALTGKLLGVLSKGDTVTLLGRSDDSKWLQINFPLTQTVSSGWALARLIQTSAAIKSLVVMTAQGTPAAGSTQVAVGATAVASPTTGTVQAPQATSAATSTPKPSVTPGASPTKSGATPTAGAKASGSIIFDTFVNGQYQINRVRADGTGLVVLVSGASEPALSPNGLQLAYHKRNGAVGAYLAAANLDGSNERILNNAANAGYPTWSPDGNNIAYHLTPSSATPGQVFRVAVGNPADNQLVALGVRPAWQPGANALLFDGCDASGSNCYSMHAAPNVFTPDPEHPAFIVKGTNGSWSPNGSQMAFQDTDAEGSINVFVANRDGSNKRQVTKGTSHDGLPIWSADGQWLFYRSDQNGTSWALYAIHLSDGASYKIVDAPVSGSDWVYEKLAIAGNY